MNTKQQETALQPSSAGPAHGKTAAVLSVLGMGLGQIYNRQYTKGLILLLLEASALFYFVRNLGHGLWGLITLGEKEQGMQKVGKLTQLVPGDHSIFLLIEGLIVLLAFIVFLAVYILNVKDAYRVGVARENGRKPNNIAQTIENIKETKFAQALLALPLLGVLFLTVMPILFMILLAFTNYSFPDHVPPAKLVDWVGFGTFKDLLLLKSWSKTLLGVLGWTIVWAVVATVTTYFGGLLVALLLQQPFVRLKGLWRTIFILPYAIPQIVSLLVMRNMFNGEFGPINQYLAYFGLEKLPWLSDPFWAKVTLIIVNMWIGIPVSMLLILGVLTTINKDLYEAAEMDGASPFAKFKAITLPMVLFSTAPILITQFAGNINNFNVIFLLTGGGPINENYQYAGSTDLLVTWLYKLTLDRSLFNMASAVGIIIFIIIASFSIYNYRRSRSYREEDMIQ